MLGAFGGFARGIAGIAGPMASSAGAWGLTAGGFTRGVAQGIWSSPTGRAATIGAGVGAAWGMLSSDTSVLGGAMIGGMLGGAGARYGGAAWGSRGPMWNSAAGAFAGVAATEGTWAGLGAARPYAGRILSNMGRGALGQAREDLGWAIGKGQGLYGRVFSNSKAAATTVSARAATAPSGTSLATNAPVSRVRSSMSGNYVVGTSPWSIAGRMGGGRRPRTTAGYWMVGG